MRPGKFSYAILAAAALTVAGLSGVWMAQPPSNSAATIPAGTSIRVNLDRPVASSINRPGEQFQASLSNPVQIGGHLILPAGTEVGGKIVNVHGARNPRGGATLRLTLDFIRSRGQTYEMHTTDVVRYRQQETATLDSLEGSTAMQDVSIPAESTLSFRLIEPLRLPTRD